MGAGADGGSMLYRVIAKIQHSNGDIEPRRVYLEHLSKEEAERHAWLAVRANTCVSYAWVEPEQESDKFTERDEAQLVKPTGPCVTETDANGVEWKL